MHARIHPRADTSPGADTPLQEQTPPRVDTPPPQSRHPAGADTPWSRPPHPSPPGSRLQHTVNERPLRILLECILVYIVTLHFLAAIMFFIIPLCCTSCDFCLGSQSQGGCLCALLSACNKIPRFTSAVIPANYLAASVEAELFKSTYKH